MCRGLRIICDELFSLCTDDRQSNLYKRANRWKCHSSGADIAHTQSFGSVVGGFRTTPAKPGLGQADVHDNKQNEGFIKYDFNTGQQFDVVVTDASAKEVWACCKGRMFPVTGDST